MDIENFLQNATTNFKGVFSANNIDHRLLYQDRFSIICNLSDYGKQGSHFVTIIAFPLYAIYIDSYGLPCFIPSISNFLVDLNRTIFHNSKCVQSPSSVRCGYFAILWTLQYDDDKGGANLKFSSNLERNDKLCVDYIRRLVKQ